MGVSQRQWQNSGLSHLSLGDHGEKGRRLEAATSLRTFWRLEPPARVGKEAELGRAAASVPRTDQRSGVCLCVSGYVDV